MELFLPNTLFLKKDVMLSIIWISVMSASIKGNLKLYREGKTAAILIIHYNYQYILQFQCVYINNHQKNIIPYYVL